MTTDSLDALRRAILDEALKSAPFEGWTEALLTHASEAAGENPLAWKRAFPGGVTDVLQFFSAEADTEMLKAVDTKALEKMKIRERIAWLVRTRLEQQLPHREAIRRAVAASAMPTHYPYTLKSLHATVDTMWIAAGDTSTDFNWYTKRFLLAKVYGATLMVWLRDDSEGQEETWAFLDRRIQNVMSLGKTIGQIKGKMEEAGDFITRRMRNVAR